jgi:hypothetical protein
MFQKAVKEEAKLRAALESPAGFGKSMTALKVATYLAEKTGGRIAALDTEYGSLSKYAHLFDFDVVNVDPPFHPQKLVDAIRQAVEGDYAVFVGDSFSHFWQGEGGLLEIVDTIARTKYRGDSHRAWKDAGEIQQALTDAVLRSPIHVIATMRTKTDYVRNEVEKDGRKVTEIRKQGVKTVQRAEFDYEFDFVGRFDSPMMMRVEKSRVDTLPPETVIEKPGVEFAETLYAWLSSGASVEVTVEQRERLAAALEAGAKVDASRFSEARVEALSAAMHGFPLDKLTSTQFERVVSKIESTVQDAVDASAAEKSPTGGTTPADTGEGA